VAALLDQLAADPHETDDKTLYGEPVIQTALNDRCDALAIDLLTTLASTFPAIGGVS
jgi:hypothetical protein